MNIKYYNEILGKKATMDIEYGSPLKAEMIEGKEISLREVTEADIGLLYEWINDPVCRKNSFNSHIITLEEHKDWFYRKLQIVSSDL